VYGAIGRHLLVWRPKQPPIVNDSGRPSRGASRGGEGTVNRGRGVGDNATGDGAGDAANVGVYRPFNVRTEPAADEAGGFWRTCTQPTLFCLIFFSPFSFSSVRL
jgi:hypothetical protein